MPADYSSSNIHDEPPKQTPKSVYITIIVLLIVALAALGGWYWYKTRQLNQQLSDVTSKISSLQIDKDKLAADLKKAQESTTSSSDDGYIVIKEWNVKFKPGSELTDAVYYTAGNVAYISTRSLMSTAQLALDKQNNQEMRQGSACNPANAPLGLVMRGKKGEPVQNSTYDKYEGTIKIGDYYYIVNGPQSTCSVDTSASALETKQNQALKVSIKTLQATK